MIVLRTTIAGMWEVPLASLEIRPSVCCVFRSHTTVLRRRHVQAQADEADIRRLLG